LAPLSSRVTIRHDTKVQNATTFVIEREDHTLGNMVRMQLHENPDVTFAGYKKHHPLEYNVLLKVQASQNSTPAKAVDRSLREIEGILGTIKGKFQQEVERVEAGR